MIRKIWFITILAIAPVFAVMGQSDVKAVLTGNIITSDGAPAPFIAVQLKNTTYGGTSDARGRFEFTAPAGDYTMVVQSITAHREEFPVHVEAGRRYDFPDIAIRENVSQLDEVVVTGQFSPQSMRNSLYKVRSITSEQILQKTPTSVESLLNTEVGIRLSNDMALGETSFELMGMSGSNIKILLNGIPMIDRGDKQSSLSQIDVNSIERIEIVEGPMSVVYGTDALAGVINIITRKGSEDTSVSTWRVGARVQEESAGREYQFFHGDGLHNESVDLAYNHKSGFYVNGGYTRNDYGGWTGDLTGREKRWHPKDQSMANGTVGYHARNLNVWYRLDFLDETIYGPMNGNDPKNPSQVRDKDYLSKRYTHQLQADWKLSRCLSLNGAFSFQNYRRRTFTTITDQSTGDRWLSDLPSEQDTTTYKAWVARVTAAWVVSPKLSFQPGVEYQWTQGYGDRIAGRPEISYAAWFLSAEYKPWEWMSLRPGVRSFFFADYHTPAAIPSLLTKFNLAPSLDLRLSYAYGFRTPNIQELYMSYHNDNHDIDGNPDLKAEYSHNVTGSFTWRILHNERIRLTTSLSGFYNDFKDKISLVENVSRPNFYTYYNIDRYKTVGGSLENSLVWGGLRASVNFSLIGRYNRYSADADGMDSFRFSPEVSASINYHIEKSGTDINIFYKYTGQRKEYYYREYTATDGSKQNEFYLRGLPGYNTGEIVVTQRITPYLSINAGVKNLFDLTSIQTISDSPDDTPSTSYLGCGRSWSIGLKLLLNGKFKK